MKIPTLHSFHKTRIAPTPSGFLHVGNALSFLLTASLAKQTGAKILLRIDDLDRERVEKVYVDDIFETLHFLNITWQEGPKDYDEYERTWSQVKRLSIYDDALEQLRQSGNVFACTCSRTQVLKDSPDGSYPGTCRYKNLPLDTPGASWRVKTDPNTKLRVKTLEGNIIESTLPRSMHDFIVRKKDGFPAYQLTSVIDDLHFNIDLIVRGQDLWDSTLAQLFLSMMLERPAFADTSFHHHPLIEASPGQKLSKSAGDTSIKHLRKQGMNKDGLLQVISQLS